MCRCARVYGGVRVRACVRACERAWMQAFARAWVCSVCCTVRRTLSSVRRAVSGEPTASNDETNESTSAHRSACQRERKRRVAMRGVACDATRCRVCSGLQRAVATRCNRALHLLHRTPHVQRLEAILAYVLRRERVDGLRAACSFIVSSSSSGAGMCQQQLSHEQAVHSRRSRARMHARTCTHARTQIELNDLDCGGRMPGSRVETEYPRASMR